MSMSFLEFLNEEHHQLLFKLYTPQQSVLRDALTREKRILGLSMLFFGTFLLIIDGCLLWLLHSTSNLPHIQTFPVFIFFSIILTIGLYFMMMNLKSLSPRRGRGWNWNCDREFYEKVRSIKTLLKLTAGVTTSQEFLQSIADEKLVELATPVIVAQSKKDDREVHRLIEYHFREYFDLCQDFGLADRDGWGRIMRLAEKKLDKEALQSA